MDIPNFINDFPSQQWLLWVGAGVSYSAPTSLPLGVTLTLFAMEECCGEAVTTQVQRLWTEANDIIYTPDAPAPLGTVPRLESILGDIDDVRAKSINCEFDFLLGFRTFTDASFNQNHLYIAQLLRRGVNVVTTSFDTCIEEAYKHLTHGADELLLDREFDTPCYRSHSDLTVGKVWHVHGTAQDVRSLGATIMAVKEGLPTGFHAWLDDVLSNSTLVIFLGYSASDSFDVNLYFTSQREGQFAASTGWFVQHSGAPTPPRAVLLVGPFGRRLTTTQDTTEVLQSLSGTRLQAVPVETFPWKDVFLRNAVMRDAGRVKSYLICKLAFTLGINVDLLDAAAYTNALQHEHDFDREDFHRTLAYVSRVQGAAQREQRHDILSKRGGVEMLGYHYSKGHARRALSYAKGINEMFSDARAAGGELDWRTYTSMSAHCRPIVTRYLLNPFATKVTIKDRRMIERLMELTVLLSNVPLRNVRYINQVATALRFNFLFKALLNGVQDDHTIERVLELYGEGASVAGFIATYRDVSIMYFFLHKFHRSDGLYKSMAYIDRSLRLARTVGDIPSMKRALRLTAYLRFYSWARCAFRFITGSS